MHPFALQPSQNFEQKWGENSYQVEEDIAASEVNNRVAHHCLSAYVCEISEQKQVVVGYHDSDFVEESYLLLRSVFAWHVIHLQH